MTRHGLDFDDAENILLGYYLLTYSLVLINHMNNINKN
jgi:hypothetical protein